MATNQTRAAAVIKLALERRNRQDKNELAAKLARYGLGPRYVEQGIRTIRDAYGENALVKERDGRRVAYVLDPDLDVAVADFGERARRSMTEATHLLADLNWCAANYGNTGLVRRARRLAKSLVAELEDLIEVVDA